MKYCVYIAEHPLTHRDCYQVIEVKEPIRVVEVKTREEERRELRDNWFCPCYNMYKKPVKKNWFPKWFVKSEVEEVTFVDRYTILY